MKLGSVYVIAIMGNSLITKKFRIIISKTVVQSKAKGVKNLKAFMSNLSLLMNNASFERDGKLATLWFDELLLRANDEIIRKSIEYVAEKERWNSNTL